MSNAIKIIIALFIAVLILAAFSSLYAYNYLDSPPGSMTKPVIVEVEPGTSFYAVAKDLKEKSVIDNIRKFYVYAKLREALYSIKAGEYRFEPQMTPPQILDQLLEGNVINYRITIPEGYNLYQIADLLDQKKLISKEEFLAKVHNAELIKKLGLEGSSLEGYLYPETYFFVKGMSGEEIIRAMVDSLRKILPADFEERAKKVGFTLHEVINFASIIEKETGNPAERPIISAVFHNRLKKGMRLQSDPTVIYGMIDRFDGDLKKEHLRKKTPYNTYRINGLPAGPIANPGIEAIEAALSPADVAHLYFVSMNNGSHVFAGSLVEHNRNVWRYQKRRRR